MFEAGTEVRTLNEILQSIEILSDEVRLRFSPEGLSIPVVDRANVGKCDIWVDSAAFDHYDAGRITVGVSVDKLRTIVDLSNADEHFDLEVFPERQRLFLDIEGQEFDISLYEATTVPERAETPEITNPTQLAINRREFRRAIKSADAFADSIRFISTNSQGSKFKMIAEGDTDEYRKTWMSDDLETLVLSGAESAYDLNYLDDLADAIPEESVIDIQFGHDNPAIFEYDIAGGDGEVQFVLAPRLEDD